MIELRQANGQRSLHGRFAYNSISGLGRLPFREQIAPGAFRSSIDGPTTEIWLLAHHDMERPLASKSTGTLQLRDSETELRFDAVISPEIAETSYGADLLRQAEAGLVLGVSPGFGDIKERIEQRNGQQIHVVTDATLVHLALVTFGAYPSGTVTEVRCWQPNFEPPRRRRRLLL
jgi:HK97 family phage prohead protease